MNGKSVSNKNYIQAKKELWEKVKTLQNFKETGLKWTSKMSELQEALQSKIIESEQQEIFNYFKTDVKEQVADMYNNLKEQLKQIDKISTVKVFTKDGKLQKQVIFDPNVRNNNPDLNNFIEELWDELEYWMNYIVETSQSNIIQPIFREQAYRDGLSNCLLTPVINQLEQKCFTGADSTIKKYKSLHKKAISLKNDFEKDGANKINIQKLAENCKLTIKIYDVLSQQYSKYKPKNPKESIFKFSFVNTKINHVEFSDQVTNQLEMDYLQQEDMNQFINELNDQKSTYLYKKIDDTIVQIQYDNNKILQLAEYNTYWKQEQTIRQRFQNLALTLKKFNIDPKNNQTYKSGESLFLNSSIQMSGRISLKKFTDQKLSHIDQKQAYTNYEVIEEQYRLGFPYLTDFRYVESIDFAIQYNGLYLCILKNLPKNIEWMFKPNRKYILISAMIKYLKNRNVTIQLIGGMYGKHSEMIKTSDMNYKMSFSKKKPYFTAVSKFNCSQEKIIPQNFVCYNEEFAAILHSENNTIKKDSFENKVLVKNSEYDYTRYIKKDKSHKQFFNTYKHIYAFILQYQQLNLLLQIEKMQFDKIHLICVDDIYYEEHQFEKLPYFENKETDKYKELYSMCHQKQRLFLNTFNLDDYQQYPDDSWQFGQKEDYYQYQLLLGQGGHGKTYQRQSDFGNINQIYISLTNRLVQDQKNSIFKSRGYTKDMFITLLEKQKFKTLPSNIILDEIGLVGGNFLHNIIKKKLPHCKVFCLGDQLQLQGERCQQDIDPFEQKQYDLIINEDKFQTDYRAKKCKILQKLKQQVRQYMKQGLSETNIYYKIFQLPYIQKMNESQFCSQYTIDQLIISPSNQIKNKWTDLLIDKSLPKYRINTTFEHNQILYCTGDILYELPQGLDYQKEIKLKKPKYSLQHAFSCHSLQGISHNSKCLILPPIDHSIFKGYVYTAISRLTNIQDLILYTKQE